MAKTAGSSGKSQTNIAIHAGKSRVHAAMRRKLFAERWLTNGNHATEAAIHVGFSAKTAGVKGSQLLASEEVRAIIEQRQAVILNRAKLTTERWAEEMASIGHLDPGELYDDLGNLIPIHKLPPHVRKAISSVKQTQRREGKGDDAEMITETEVKMWDKNTALANIGRHLGLFEKDNRQTITAIQVNLRLVG